MPDPRFSPSLIQQAVVRLLKSHGTREDVAESVAGVLVGADVSGYPSHGVSLLPSYIGKVRDGQIRPAAAPTSTWTAPAFLQLCAGHGWGHAVLTEFMPMVQDAATNYGLCAVALSNGGHIGRLGHYVERMARSGYLSFATTATGLLESEALVTASGTPDRHLGSNPIAFACPIQKGPPFVFDTSTSSISYFRMMEHDRAGVERLSEFFVAPSGELSSTTHAFHAGGAILPAAGHKGLGASMAAVLFAALGSKSSISLPALGGTTLVAVDLRKTAPGFQHRVGTFMAALSAEIGDGGIPGFRLARRVADSFERGVYLAPSTREALRRLLREANVSDVLGSKDA